MNSIYQLVKFSVAKYLCSSTVPVVRLYGCIRYKSFYFQGLRKMISVFGILMSDSNLSSLSLNFILTVVCEIHVMVLFCI